jgi:hypothetical protein
MLHFRVPPQAKASSTALSERSPGTLVVTGFLISALGGSRFGIGEQDVRHHGAHEQSADR